MPASNADKGGGAPDPQVTVAISTLGQGIRRIQLPAPTAGVTYLILLQRPQEAAPEPLAALRARADAALVPLADLGLSNSRNAALIRARTPFLLFADDDQILDPAGILDLADRFRTQPDLGLVAGWRAERLPTAAPAQTRLTRFNSGRICAPEFMVRRAAVQAAGVTFDPAFGLGARHGVGEDYVFVCDLLQAGLRGIAVPVITGSHPHASTGDNWADPALLAARRAVIARVFGRWAPLVRLAYGLRHRKRMGGWGRVARFILSRKEGLARDKQMDMN